MLWIKSHYKMFDNVRLSLPTAANQLSLHCKLFFFLHILDVRIRPSDSSYIY